MDHNNIAINLRTHAILRKKYGLKRRYSPQRHRDSLKGIQQASQPYPERAQPLASKLPK